MVVPCFALQDLTARELAGRLCSPRGHSPAVMATSSPGWYLSPVSDFSSSVRFSVPVVGVVPPAVNLTSPGLHIFSGSGALFSARSSVFAVVAASSKLGTSPSLVLGSTSSSHCISNGRATSSGRDSAPRGNMRKMIFFLKKLHLC